MSQRPEEIVVVTFFTGSPHEKVSTYWDKLSGFADSDEAHAKRFEENEAALKDAERIDLGYLDSQYRTLRDDKGLEERLTNAIRETLTRHKGQTVSVLAPGIFPAPASHPDHKLVHEALYSVASTWEDRKHVSFYFYEDMPYAAVNARQGGAPVEELLIARYPENRFGKLIVPISNELLHQKLARIEKYPTQVETLSFLDGPLFDLIEKYMCGRCADSKLFACEVVYRIEN